MRTLFFLTIISIGFSACLPSQPTQEQKIKAAVKQFEQRVVPLRIGATDVCVIALFHENEPHLEIVMTIPAIPCNSMKVDYPVLKPFPSAITEVFGKYSTPLTMSNFHEDGFQDRFRKLLE
jgi:hypothetical protein